MNARAQRLARLEKQVSPKPLSFNREYLAAISDDDLEFVAALPIYDEEGGPLDAAIALLTTAEQRRLNDICRRMRHGPDA